MNKQGMEQCSSQAGVGPELFTMKPSHRKIPKQVIISIIVTVAAIYYLTENGVENFCVLFMHYILYTKVTIA